jgi:hypothetical protein
MALPAVSGTRGGRTRCAGAHRDGGTTRLRLRSRLIGACKGRIAPGCDADLVLPDLPDLEHFGYGLGEQPVRVVFRGGHQMRFE